ncbi:MAG TPA: hypothetical protein VL095_10005 [Flavisolibacter sp.]|nr:hypothetical protein [Flavisolibacter sp.]
MRYRILAFILLIIPFISNAQVSSVRLTVHVPALAENKNVFVAGSFNNWKAGDSLYKMKQLDATTYTIILPVFKNTQYKYKYLLGNWNEVEIALNDSNTNNRQFVCPGRKKKITDTVMKWATPKPVAKTTVSPQMARFNAMKDSVLNGLQPKLNEMLQLLREYTLNLLQEHPNIETDNRITADVVKHFTDAYGRINGLFHKIFESLTPEQKQKILKAVTAKEGDKDFINTLGAAVNEAVK